MPKKSLVIDVHHHWIPDEHYRRPELHVHQDEEVIHEADRFRIRRAGVQLFSPPRMTARMDEQLKAMDRAGVDQAALHVGVWLDWVDIKAARLINDRLAELDSRYPGRIIPLAHVPPLDHEAARELKRAIVDLGFKGVAMNTHIDGILMGSDFPTIDQLKNAVTIIQKARATAQVKKKVMGDNARKLFGRR